MPSLSDNLLKFGLLLLLVGGLLGGTSALREATITCESGYGMGITKLGENESATLASDQVAYTNLSTHEQQVFEEIVTAESTPVYQNQTVLNELSEKVITYHGDRYETHPVFITDCPSSPGILLGFGGLTAVLGVVLVGGVVVLRRVR